MRAHRPSTGTPPRRSAPASAVATGPAPTTNVVGLRARAHDVEAVRGDIPQDRARQQRATRPGRLAASSSRIWVAETSGIVDPVATLPAGSVEPAAADDDRRRARDDVVPAVPLVGLAEDVGADDEPELRVGVLRVEVLDEIERPARDEVGPLRELLLGAADARARAERRRGELAHRDAMVERRERLAERVLVGRHEPQLVDGCVSST